MTDHTQPRRTHYGDMHYENRVVFRNPVPKATLAAVAAPWKDLGFSLEAGEAIGIVRDGIRQNFQRDFTIQPIVMRLVNDAHTPVSKLFTDPVLTQRSA